MPFRRVGRESGDAMRILFDLCHPAHFHLFKNAITALRGRGEDVQIVAHQKDCLIGLLASSGWPYRLVKRTGSTLPALAGEAARSLALLVSMAMQKPFDLMVGTSVAAGPAARMTGSASLIFSEDDSAVVPLFAKLAYATATYVVTPAALRHENLGRKHLTYPGFHELAYLHPARYTPDPTIRKDLGLAEGERCFLVRLVALKAHHDAGAKGLGLAEARQVIARLQPHGRVFISAETQIAPELQPLLLPTPPQRIFDVLALADLVVGDSQTMAIESAVLGTPALRCNTFVGRLSVMEELEHKYGLTVGIHPRDFPRLLTVLGEWLARKDLKQEWQLKRQRLISECVDLTAWILELFDRLHRARQAAGHTPSVK
jgi:predicted glycosyltransferase